MQLRNTEAPATPAAPGRPFTARSVLASTLLGADPPELSVAHLVHMAGLFGINPNRARVALSRMVSSEEATTDGAGRYRLAGHLLARQRRQAVSRAGRTGPWSGQWRLIVLTSVGDTAGVRAERRRELVAARLGELRQGVWGRPDNLERDLDEALGQPGQPGGDLLAFLGRPSSDPLQLAAALWDLEGWAWRADSLIEEMRTMPTRGPDDLAAGFVLSATVLRHLQADPLLPEELLPHDWPGGRLRVRYDEFDARYRAVLGDWGRRLP